MTVSAVRWSASAGHVGELGGLGHGPEAFVVVPVQVLLFLLVTLLGVATGNVIKSPGVLPWGLELLRRESLPLAGITVLLIIGVMAWQHRIEHGHVLRAHPVWDSERSPFPGLEAFADRTRLCSLAATPRSSSCLIVFIR